MRKVLAGEPLRIRAEDYNAMVDAARWLRERRGHLGRPGVPRVHDVGPTVLVRNETGETVPRWSVLVLQHPVGDVQLERHQDELILSGAKPSTQNTGARPAVLLETAQPQHVVRAVVDGITLARVRRAENYMHARLSPGEYIFVAAPSGPAELVHVPSTSEGLATIRLGPRYDWFWGKIIARTYLGVFRWHYHFIEVSWRNNTWAEVVGGHAGIARNVLEHHNSGAGEFGNGYPAAHALLSPCNVSAPSMNEAVLPIGINAVVPICAIYDPGPGSVESYWFAQTNTVYERSRMFRFVLTQTLQAGGEASATLLGWHPGANAYECNLGFVQVRDALGCFFGPAGTPGWCVFMHDSGFYEVVSLCC